MHALYAVTRVLVTANQPAATQPAKQNSLHRCPDQRVKIPRVQAAATNVMSLVGISRGMRTEKSGCMKYQQPPSIILRR